MGKNPSNSVLVLRLPVARNSPLLSPLGEENVSQKRGRGICLFRERRRRRANPGRLYADISPWKNMEGRRRGGGIGRGECSVIYRRKEKGGKGLF